VAVPHHLKLRIETDVLIEDEFVADDRTSHNPAEQSEANDLRAHIIDALGNLPEKLRSVIVLRDIYDLSHDVIAKQLDISETAAKVRLHRARQKLREQLFGEDIAMSDNKVVENSQDGTTSGVA
jgi:RNA polymerase sigma-70 factor, ECF subfamily